MWNRIAALMIIVTASSLLLTPLEVEARGGRGGGGRSAGGARGGGARGGVKGAGGARGGKAYRGGHSMNRTPTMSRASNRPVGSQAGQRPQTRPSAGRGGVKQSRQGLQQRPSSVNRSDLRSQVNRYAQNRSVPNIDRQALSKKAQNFSSQRSNQSVQNRRLSENTSKRLQQSRRDYNNWFDRDFFDRHHVHGDYWGTGANWWRPAAWATLATWGAWNWATPYYYDDSGYAYPLSSAESIYPYSTTTIQTPQSPQEFTSSGDDWLPLGVFAVANNANAAVYTNRFIQLAINRNGEIAGVLYNSSTDAAQDLTGMVDSNSQLAYWSMDDRIDSPIASTGIYNLTEDQTPINVHFADGSEQTWTLVRLQQ